MTSYPDDVKRTRLWSHTLRVETNDPKTATHKAKSAVRDQMDGQSDLTARTIHQTANHCYVTVTNLRHVDTEDQR